jgi:hypothetical protein
VLRNSAVGKQVARGPDAIGVDTPIASDDYLRIFSTFACRARDGLVFGKVAQTTGFVSEVMILEKELAA